MAASLKDDERLLAFHALQEWLKLAAWLGGVAM
ncbi:hypothetical protein HK44_018410 [Pseudomonas fluorescens HK44]|uniref:Uncharacterized protein n=1 Tax=Pseudomonas fluorescens HK44 TaxID=1042209 RepID=A0A010SDX2_PSEFL|nr:hypothetical protein HK44_018410 [Pseudomonas fluorescens HK44]